jgi:hypothetical protein
MSFYNRPFLGIFPIHATTTPATDETLKYRPHEGGRCLLLDFSSSEGPGVWLCMPYEAIKKGKFKTNQFGQIPQG